MKVSVVIATYNGEKYILKQLESLFTQKRKPDEVIICDDKSWDGTVEVIDKYIARKHLEDEWHVYVNETRLGYSENFFNAISKATGDYIFLCDQDDGWLEDKIKEMTEIMEKNSDIGLLCSEYIPFARGGEVQDIKKNAARKMRYNNVVEKLELDKDTIASCMEGCTMCIRRSFFESVEKYRIPRVMYNEFIWKLALAEDVCYIYHKALMKRRFYAVSTCGSRTARIKRHIAGLRRTLAGNEMTLDFLKKNNKSGVETEFLEKNIDALKLKIELVNDRKLKNMFILLTGYRQYCK
ncbi:MAG: glycosyltransferase [Lachnospiraceae bacterium]|nr:glycosyltransferase [Lachnospiraceae bacterium]